MAPSTLGPESMGKPDMTLSPAISSLSHSKESTETIQDDSTIKTIDQLVRRRARSSPSKTIVSYPSSGIDFVDYTLEQLDVFAFRAAKHYQNHIPTRQSSDEKPTTVAMLGPSNFEYLITMLAMMKLGHTILFLSTRISQAAVDNLIEVTGAKYLLVDPRFNEMAAESQKSLPDLQLLDIASQSLFDFPIEIHADTNMTPGFDPEIETSNIVYVIHSSGSTGLPKPIYQRQGAAISNFAISMEMKAFITLPLYHNHGICNLFRAVYSGKSIHIYNADLPLTHDYLVQTMTEHQFEIFYGVPYALKLLAESESGISVLQQLKVVMYGGSACPDDLGDMLVEKGVNLIGHYGATEVGQLMTSFRPPEDKAWNYVREHSRLTPFLRWLPQGGNLFECCVTPGWPAKIATNMDDGSYATKDLFEPHPTIPQAWKYIARRDDTLNLINGEMFNPVSTEGTIRSNKNVQEAVIFGAGRPSLGALVIPAASLAGKTEEEILEIIWPVVESACANVEAYARISKDMIKLLPWDCAYPRTDKGSIIRHAFYKEYAREIDEVYTRSETSNEDLVKLSLPQLQNFLRGLITEVLSKKVEMTDDSDFFALGLDSLQAIRIRSEIVKTVDVGGQKLGQTVVFDRPSVAKLSAYLFALSSGSHTHGDVPIESEMQELIEEYSKIPSTFPRTRSSVIVTGVSGSLGAHIVTKLVSDPTIQTIYCLVRAKSDEHAYRRVVSSLIQRRVYHNLPLLHRQKLVALASDLSREQLGLSDDTYRKVRKSLRLVIHCAWPVNFNMRLSSFQDSGIASVTNLISLCRAAGNGASFNFCSSVSAVAKATTVPVPEAVPRLEWAQDMGYAQSKSVAENICLRVAEQSGDVPTRVLRLGQIVADTVHGVWNATEAIPLMIQSALTIGALPKLSETPSWLPVNVMAQAVADISLSDAQGSTFTNVTNPRTFHWTNDLLPALRKAGLSFEEVEPKEWVRRLRESNTDPVVNPPIKLVDFFASKYDKDEFSPSKTYVTETACHLSPALAASPVLDQTLVESFVNYFQHGPWVAAKPESAETAATASADRLPSNIAIVVAGPCGSGKSTIAAAISSTLRFPIVEGDSLHSKASVDKMAANVALTDEDRVTWLNRIGSRAVETINELGYGGVVVTCSALKKSYRDALRGRVSANGAARLLFVDLQCLPETLKERVTDRKDHYMPSSLVESQVALYEGASASEIDVIPVDAEASAEEVFERVKLLLEEYGVGI